jgi:hypothetical protein
MSPPFNLQIRPQAFLHLPGFSFRLLKGIPGWFPNLEVSIKNSQRTLSPPPPQVFTVSFLLKKITRNRFEYMGYLFKMVPIFL